MTKHPDPPHGHTGGVFTAGTWRLGYFCVTTPDMITSNPAQRSPTVICASFTVDAGDLFDLGTTLRIEVSGAIEQLDPYVTQYFVVIVNGANEETIWFGVDAPTDGAIPPLASEGGMWPSTGQPFGAWSQSVISAGTAVTPWVPLVTTNTALRPCVISPPPAAPKIPLVKCAPQSIISSPSPNAGCSKGGTGWRRTYNGPSGTVPIGADPVDGETMTGKTAAHLWIEITHTNY